MDLVITARSQLREVLSLALSVTFVCVYEMSRERLNGYAPNSQGRSLWSLARTSLKVKVKRHQVQKRHFSAACVRFMFVKTFLTLEI